MGAEAQVESEGFHKAMDVFMSTTNKDSSLKDRHGIPYLLGYTPHVW